MWVLVHRTLAFRSLRTAIARLANSPHITSGSPTTSTPTSFTPVSYSQSPRALIDKAESQEKYIARRNVLVSESAQ